MNRAPLPCRLEGKRVLVAGPQGRVSSALLHRLRSENCDLIAAPPTDVDIRRLAEVEECFADLEPDVVFVAPGSFPDMPEEDTRPMGLLCDNLIMATRKPSGAENEGFAVHAVAS